MPNRANKKRPLDNHQELARKALDAIVPDAELAETEQDKPSKNPAAVALGRLGGLKGGKSRAAKLSPAKRRAIARKAAQKRWGQPKGKSKG